MADVNISDYTNSINTPQNPLEMVGQYANARNALIQNQLIQQHVEQAKIATQKSMGQQEIAKLLAKHTDDSGKLDALGFKSEAAKNPMAAMNWDMVSDIADPMLTPEEVGYQPNGAKRTVTTAEAQQELANASKPQNSTPSNSGNVSTAASSGNVPTAPNSDQPPTGIPGSLPPGFEQQVGERTATNQDYITNTRDAAGEASNQVVMLDKIKALAKKTQTGPYAERINKFRAGLAELFGTEPNSPATYEQLNKYMLANGLGQAAQNGANSDARTLAYVNSNPNTGILPEAVLPLAEYQQALYRQKIGERNGLEKTLSKIDSNNPTQLNPAIESYRHEYSNNTNPQFYEYKNLPDAESKKTFIASHPGFAAQVDKLKKLKALGAIE